MRKDDSPPGPGPAGDAAPVVERDERDRRALAARISDNAGPPSMLAAVPAPAAGGDAAPAARRRTGRSRGTGSPPFVPASAAEALNARMREVIASFVDTPAEAVTDAEDVLGEAVAALTEAMAERRKDLADRRAAAGTDTEQLRLTLIACRSAVQALLKT